MRSTGVVVGLTSGPATGKPWNRFDPDEHTEVQIHNGMLFCGHSMSIHYVIL